MGQDLASIRRFVEDLARSYRIEAAYLFGSRAKGDHLLCSDIDLLLVSNDFHGRSFSDRIVQILRRWKGEVDLQPFCYTVEEFERKRHQLGCVQEAVRHGIRLL
ncbi:nucleotidyltransferase domain-containing protein [Acidobacteria bacterium AH-259-L09]|nr:nucleotidyltransferase domain-containing protein [Acidobacteria bacterium AH-259-L09]